MFISKSTSKFYNDVIHSDSMPEDVVEISYTDYLTLLSGLSSGMEIVFNEQGEPYLKQLVVLPTFKESLQYLNTLYQADVDKYNKAFMTAYLVDGPEQESKQLGIRAEYVLRKAQYAAEVMLLREQFQIGV